MGIRSRLPGRLRPCAVRRILPRHPESNLVVRCRSKAAAMMTELGEYTCSSWLSTGLLRGGRVRLTLVLSDPMEEDCMIRSRQIHQYLTEIPLFCGCSRRELEELSSL